MRDRTAEHVMRELIETATSRGFFESYLSGSLPSRRSGERDHEIRLKHNAENVGKLVQELPEADRKLIENLTPEELNSFVYQFGGVDRMRPKEPVNRIRGPVKLGGRSREKDDG